MGWTVISKCWISFDAVYHGIVEQFIKNKMSNNYGFKSEGAGEIYFETSGNKKINYSGLEALRDFCVISKIRIEINCNDFVESGDGFYFNSENEKKLKKNVGDM